MFSAYEIWVVNLSAPVSVNAPVFAFASTCPHVTCSVIFPYWSYENSSTVSLWVESPSQVTFVTRARDTKNLPLPKSVLPHLVMVDWNRLSWSLYISWRHTLPFLLIWSSNSPLSVLLALSAANSLWWKYVLAVLLALSTLIAS